MLLKGSIVTLTKAVNDKAQQKHDETTFGAARRTQEGETNAFDVTYFVLYRINSIFPQSCRDDADRNNKYSNEARGKEVC